VLLLLVETSRYRPAGLTHLPPSFIHEQQTKAYSKPFPSTLAYSSVYASQMTRSIAATAAAAVRCTTRSLIGITKTKHARKQHTDVSQDVSISDT